MYTIFQFMQFFFPESRKFDLCSTFHWCYTYSGMNYIKIFIYVFSVSQIFHFFIPVFVSVFFTFFINYFLKKNFLGSHPGHFHRYNVSITCSVNSGVLRCIYRDVANPRNLSGMHINSHVNYDTSFFIIKGGLAINIEQNVFSDTWATFRRWTSCSLTHSWLVTTQGSQSSKHHP